MFNILLFFLLIGILFKRDVRDPDKNHFFVSPAVSRSDTKGSLLRPLSVRLSVLSVTLFLSHFEITQVLLILLIFISYSPLSIF